MYDIANQSMQDRFQILSLDGGGIKGLFSAYLLQKLEEDLQIDIASCFDLIIGTSTGGIIALALGMQKTPAQIVDLYSDLGTSIFPGPRWLGELRQYLAVRYSSKPLENELKKCFPEEQLLGHSKKRLVIPSYDLGQREVRVFKTAHDERFTRDYKVPAWQIAMATSAAPTYFQAFRSIEERRLIDGGVWANNPVIAGIVEAVGVLKIPLPSVRVLSIGTTAEVTYPPDKLDRGGFWQWKKGAAVIMDAQSSGATGQAYLLLGKDRFKRINLSVPKDLFALDKPAPEKLRAAASHVSMHEAPDIKRIFLDHAAQPFTPKHQLEK